MLAALYCNAHRKEGSKPTAPGDFFGHTAEPEAEMSDTQMLAMMRAYTASHNKNLTKP